MLDVRYICVDLNIQNEKILRTLFLHVPQTYKASKDRIKQKEKMLSSTSDFVSENCNNLLFVGGDMNSDIDGKTTTCINVFEEIYKKLIDTDSKKRATNVEYDRIYIKSRRINTIILKIYSIL